MSTLLEDPLPALVCGGFVELFLLVALWRTGRGVILGWMAGVGLLTGGMVLLERLVVTDREQILESVETLRAAVEKGDIDTALDQIAGEAGNVRQVLSSTLRRYRFSNVRIFQQDITFNRDSKPDGAKVLVSGMVTLCEGSNKTPIGQFGGSANLHFRRADGRWILTDVTDIREGIPGLPAKGPKGSSDRRLPTL